MPAQHPDSPLGDFLAALAEAKIKCILIGGMAAVHQGAPIATVDYDLWVKLPERQYVKLLTIIQRQGGTIFARTAYELRDGTVINVIFRPDGLRSFDAEFRRSRMRLVRGYPVRVLPMRQIIASKRASGRDKDLMVMHVLEESLRLARRLRSRRSPRKKSAP